MKSSIFFDEFERTEFSDGIHAVIGRSLIVATRFDNLCVSLSRLTDFRQHSCLVSVLPKGEYDKVINKIFDKYRNLNRVIQGFPLDEDIKRTLHEARRARNEIAHSFTIGFEGTFDHMQSNVIEAMVDEIKILIRRVTKGDVIISTYISMMNKEDILNNCFESSYEDKVIDWVTKRYEA